MELQFNRDIPVRHEVDVLVAGGGPAGCAAAVAAAQQGASVFVAEGHSCFGGMGTAGLVPWFCMFGDGVHFHAGGVGRLVYDEVYARGGTSSPAGSMSPAIRAEVLKRIYDDLLTDSGVGFSLMTQIIGIEQEGPRLTHAICWGKSGLFAIAAKAFVDCTGDGDLCAWGGASVEQGDADGGLMPGTLCSLWSGIDWARVNASRGEGLRDDSRCAEAGDDGVFTIPDKHLPGMCMTSVEGVGGGNIGHTFGVDNTDERSVTQALVWGRKLMLEYERYYKEYLRGYEAMQLVATGSLLGIRETRRIMGDYVLVLSDFQNQSVFDDEIGRFAYPVDIHASSNDEAAHAKFMEEFTTLRYKAGESYGIPYRALVPRNLDNVLVAGRCISADRYLQASVRVMPGCYITGQAAGVAAALTAAGAGDTRRVDVSELQGRLKKLGAFLPNA
ncbi:MAG: FAD-dependent oxidoreductase [Armatimonadetes bacterium]|nr:FAD-dependent oxidoreductase [Armatimonadota bacterium]